MLVIGENYLIIPHRIFLQLYVIILMGLFYICIIYFKLIILLGYIAEWIFGITIGADTYIPIYLNIKSFYKCTIFLLPTYKYNHILFISIIVVVDLLM